MIFSEDIFEIFPLKWSLTHISYYLLHPDTTPNLSTLKTAKCQKKLFQILGQVPKYQQKIF